MTPSTPLPPVASETLSAPARPELTGGRRVGVLLVHGITGNPVSMNPWGSYLAERGYAVEVPLLPGHGTTWEDANTTTYTDWYGEVQRVFDQLRSEVDVVRGRRVVDGRVPRTEVGGRPRRAGRGHRRGQPGRRHATARREGSPGPQAPGPGLARASATTSRSRAARSTPTRRRRSRRCTRSCSSGSPSSRTCRASPSRC